MHRQPGNEGYNLLTIGQAMLSGMSPAINVNRL